MSELFEVAELVKVAVDDEATGVVFYNAIAEKVTNPKLKKLFADLAEEELYHKTRFEQMLADLGPKVSREEYPGQYTEYLRALTGERAFPDEQTAMQIAAECDSDAEAVNISSRFERDTLVLMNEMRHLVPDKDQAVVDELIREEQGHLVQLAQARTML